MKRGGLQNNLSIAAPFSLNKEKGFRIEILKYAKTLR